MALNQFMHPRNRYKHKKPDFAALAVKYPDFKRHLSASLTGKVSLDFKDPEALRSLTCTLLREDFGIELVIPLDRIIPTVPLRLNYILWIEDLLGQSGHGGLEEIHGIDIGCGTSCIYPLLGAKLNDWHFAASEVDPTAASFAALNVKRNNLSDKINVIEAEPDDMLQGVVKAAPRSLYHFTMCNPPFFGNILEAQGIMTSRSVDRSEPFSVSTAAEGEMIWGEGGEVDFVGRMIKDSLQLREQVVWYTSMVGKKASLGPIKKELAKHKIRNVTATEFCQGRTMRWGIAWTFYDDIKLPESSPAKKFKRDKERPPVVIDVPDVALQQAMSEVSPGSKVKAGGSGDQQKVKAIAKVMEKLLATLEIDFKSKSAPKLCLRYVLTAHRNTWSNQRQKRRQMSRQRPPKDESPPDPETIVTKSCPEPTEARQACANKPRRPTNAGPNIGDGRTTKDVGDKKDLFCKTHGEVNTKVEHSGECDCKSPTICGDNDYSLAGEDPQETLKAQVYISDDDSLTTPQTMLESQECLTSKSGCGTPPEGSRQRTDPAANPNTPSQEPTSNTSCTDTDRRWGQPEQISPPEGSKREAVCLFKCVLTVKISDRKVVVEISWTEGRSREAMHQVGQYIKNQLNKKV